jgi:hypothetical protein
MVLNKLNADLPADSFSALILGQMCKVVAMNRHPDPLLPPLYAGGEAVSKFSGYGCRCKRQLQCRLKM